MPAPVNVSQRVPLSVGFVGPGDYLLFLFHVLFGGGAALVSGSVLLAIARTPPLLRQNRFLFMLNTSLADALSGCGVFYLCLFDVRIGFPSRNGTFYILPSLLGVNMMTFLFAQFDRYAAVCHPFFYSRFGSRRLVVCVNLYSWLHVYGQLLVQHVVSLSEAIQIELYSRVCLQIIVYTKITMTIKLLIVAKYQLARHPPGPERDSKKESLLIIIVVVVFFLALWSPAVVHTVVKRTTGKGLVIRNEATNPLSILSRSNAIFTPSLYLWASPSLRAAAWAAVWSRVFPCRGRKRAAKGDGVTLGIPH